jgi:hypothetical protein
MLDTDEVTTIWRLVLVKQHEALTRGQGPLRSLRRGMTTR